MTSSLWVDRYRPTSLSKLDYHKEQAKWLGRLVRKVYIVVLAWGENPQTCLPAD